MTTGEKIARIRKGNNLSQEQFAEILGISRQAVSKWENGTAVPSKESIALIADTFSLPVAVLYQPQDELPRQEPELLAQAEKSDTGRKTFWTYAAVFAIFVFITLYILDMRREIEFLETQTARLSEQLSQVYSYIDVLHSQCSPQTDRYTAFDYTATDYDRATGMVTVNISVTPTDYTQNTSARFMAVNSGGSYTAEATLQDHSYTASLTYLRQEDTPLYMYLDDSGHIRSFFVSYMPDITKDFRLNIRYAGLVGMYLEDGALDARNARIDITYEYTINSTNDDVTVYPVSAVAEIYADGVLVDSRYAQDISGKNHIAQAEKITGYTAGQTVRCKGYGTVSYNDGGNMIYNEKITNRSDIEIKLIFTDNHGQIYEKYIDRRVGVKK